MRFWFTTTGNDTQQVGPARVEEFRQSLRALPDCRYRLADTPAQADIIVYFEPNDHKFADYPRRLLSEDLIRHSPEKCFTVDYVDEPIGFLPGVYVAMPRDQWDADRFRAGCYLTSYNRQTTALAERRDARPRLLFSFCGSASHPVRETLFGAGFGGPDISVRRIVDRWFNHSDQEMRSYAEEILDSKFVLTPRGLGTASVRMFEVMELGRVPVILSDQWVPPVGPAWADCTVRVAEDKVGLLPDILRGHEDRAEEMGRAARRAWEDWFSPQTRLVRALQSLEDLWLSRPASHREKDHQDQWLSLRFAWQHGWTPAQSLARNVRQGTLLGKLKARALPRAGANGHEKDRP